MAALRDRRRVVERLRGVGEKLPHLLLGLEVELPALIAHAVLVGELLVGLQAQQDVMRLRVLFTDVVDIVSRDERYPRLLMHAQKSRVDRLLIAVTVILQFKEIVAFPKDFLIPQGRRLGLVIKMVGQIPRHFARQASGQRDNALVIALQNLQVDPRFIVISIDKSVGDDLHQVAVACVVLR